MKKENYCSLLYVNVLNFKWAQEDQKKQVVLHVDNLLYVFGKCCFCIQNDDTNNATPMFRKEMLLLQRDIAIYKSI